MDSPIPDRMKTILLIATGLGLCALAKAQNVNYNVNMTPGELDARRQAGALANDPSYQYGLMNVQATFEAFQRHLHDENRARDFYPSPDVVLVVGRSTPSGKEAPATPGSRSGKETPVTPAYNQSTGATYNPSPDVVVVGRRADGSTYRLEGKTSAPN
jgi:hypothetical protein